MIKQDHITTLMDDSSFIAEALNLSVVQLAELFKNKIESALKENGINHSWIDCFDDDNFLVNIRLNIGEIFIEDNEYDESDDLWRLTNYYDDIKDVVNTYIMNHLTQTEETCKICGCTWNNACPVGCFWVDYELCSECASEEQLKAYYQERNNAINDFDAMISEGEKQ